MLCQYFGICNGLNAKLDSYRFVFSIIERILIPMCGTNFQNAVPYFERACNLFFMPSAQKDQQAFKDKNVSNLFQSNTEVIRKHPDIVHFKYNPCNLDKDHCRPFPSTELQEPQILKPVDKVLEDFNKLYNELYAKDFTP